MEEKLTIYEAVRDVPKNAQKTITGGRLNGKTDINPMWRIKALTEQFGPCGYGWRYVITKQWIETGVGGEVSAFCNIDLFVKFNGEWSEAIPGTGGSAFVAKESKGLYTSDECYKMALTDAISVACKALGFGADIYWNADRTKYDANPQQKKAAKPAEPASNGIMTKEEFKKRWESNERGGGITFDDIAACAIAWGVCTNPRTKRIEDVRDKVLAAAGCSMPDEKKTIDPQLLPGGARFQKAVEQHAHGEMAGARAMRDIWINKVHATPEQVKAFDEAVFKFKVDNNLV